MLLHNEREGYKVVRDIIKCFAVYTVTTSETNKHCLSSSCYDIILYHFNEDTLVVDIEAEFSSG